MATNYNASASRLLGSARGSTYGQVPASYMTNQYESLLGQSGSVAGALLSGSIPADVQAKLKRSAAEKGFTMGAGAAGTRNLYARDLGLTTLDLQQQGATMAGQAYQLAESSRQANLEYANAVRSQNLDFLKSMRTLDLESRGQDISLQQTRMQQQTAQRGQNIDRANALLQASLTRRGQSLDYAATRRGQDISLAQSRIQASTARRAQTLDYQAQLRGQTLDYRAALGQQAINRTAVNLDRQRYADQTALDYATLRAQALGDSGRIQAQMMAIEDLPQNAVTGINNAYQQLFTELRSQLQGMYDTRY